MLPSRMRAAVLQTTALYVFSLIISNHHDSSILAPIWENEGYLNMSYALGNASSSNSTNTTSGRLALDAGDSTNSTISLNNGTGLGTWTPQNGTSSARGNLPEEPFYTRILPGNLVILLILSALQYLWLMLLEKMLPARPRRRQVAYQHEEKVEETEDREEEVVKKWIAQGRVRRASLNWCNTFLKWLLQVTVGRACYYTVYRLLEDIILRESPKQLVASFKKNLIVGCVGNFFTTQPLADLIAFIVIPAHKQMVFLAGADVVTRIFFTTLLRVVASWAVKTDFVQTMMRDTTENAEDLVRGVYYNPSMKEL